MPDQWNPAGWHPWAAGRHRGRRPSGRLLQCYIISSGATRHAGVPAQGAQANSSD